MKVKWDADKKAFSELQCGLLDFKQSRALGSVSSLHGNKVLSQVETAVILTVIEGEILYKEIQRDSLP